MRNLTAKQKTVLRIIEDTVSEDGIPPTYRDIATQMGVSVGTTQTHIKALRQKGCLADIPIGSKSRRARGLVPMNHVTGRKIPVLGTVPAGPLSQAFELADENITLDPDYLPRGQIFGLNVSGDSMIDAGILEDDIVIVRSQQKAEQGEIVVARMGEDATVKRLIRRRDRWYLKPENPTYDLIPASNAEIIGKVVGLFRRF